MSSAERKSCHRVARKQAALFWKALKVEKKGDLSSLGLNVTGTIVLTSKPTVHRAIGAE